MLYTNFSQIDEAALLIRLSSTVKWDPVIVRSVGKTETVLQTRRMKKMHQVE